MRQTDPSLGRAERKVLILLALVLTSALALAPHPLGATTLVYVATLMAKIWTLLYLSAT